MTKGAVLNLSPEQPITLDCTDSNQRKHEPHKAPTLNLRQHCASRRSKRKWMEPRSHHSRNRVRPQPNLKGCAHAGPVGPGDSAQCWKNQQRRANSALDDTPAPKCGKT